MNKLKVGDKAPSFSAKDENGKIISLTDFIGKKLLLYFYPKDNTSGCTAQACNLRDNYDDILNKGLSVIGVSPDNEKSHLNFIAKQNLPFSLIADTEKELAEVYGVWTEKKMYGKTYMGIARTTFLINEKGIIEQIIEKVDTKNHAKQIAALN